MARLFAVEMRSELLRRLPNFCQNGLDFLPRSADSLLIWRSVPSRTACAVGVSEGPIRSFALPPPRPDNKGSPESLKRRHVSYPGSCLTRPVTLRVRHVT